MPIPPGPFPFEAVRDLLGIARAMYAVETDGERRAALAEIGTALRKAGEQARRPPVDSLGAKARSDGRRRLRRGSAGLWRGTCSGSCTRPREGFGGDDHKVRNIPSLLLPDARPGHIWGALARSQGADSDSVRNRDYCSWSAMAILLTRLFSWIHGRRRPEHAGLTPDEIRAEIDSLARAHLGVSGDEALRMLDAGAYQGTGIEVELKARRFLLGDEPAGSGKRSSDSIQSAQV